MVSLVVSVVETVVMVVVVVVTRDEEVNNRGVSDTRVFGNLRRLSTGSGVFGSDPHFIPVKAFTCCPRPDLGGRSLKSS